MPDSEISAVTCLQICFDFFFLPVLLVIVLQKVKMLSITCLDAQTFLTFFHSTRDFHPLNVNILLFGDNSLTDVDNTRIFTAVQTFIKDSKRFVN